MKNSFWKPDWVAGMVISLLFLFAVGSAILQNLERIAHKVGVHASTRVADMDRWPWSRDVHARMTVVSAGAQAKVVGDTVFSVEPQMNPSQNCINRISEFIEKNSPSDIQTDAGTEVYALEELHVLIKEAKSQLGTNAKLGESFKNAAYVVVAMPFMISEPRAILINRYLNP